MPLIDWLIQTYKTYKNKCDLKTCECMRNIDVSTHYWWQGGKAENAHLHSTHTHHIYIYTHNIHIHTHKPIGTTCLPLIVIPSDRRKTPYPVSTPRVISVRRLLKTAWSMYLRRQRRRHERERREMREMRARRARRARGDKRGERGATRERHERERRERGE